MIPFPSSALQCIVNGEENPFPAICDAAYRQLEIGKPCSTMQKNVIKIVIEIYAEQTRLFQCNRGSTTPIFVIEIVIEFFRTRSARSKKILTEIGKKSIIERTRLFSM